jgi:hypothetical protein
VFDGVFISEMIFTYTDVVSCYQNADLYDASLADNTFKLKLSFANMADCAVDQPQIVISYGFENKTYKAVL